MSEKMLQILEVSSLLINQKIKFRSWHFLRDICISGNENNYYAGEYLNRTKVVSCHRERERESVGQKA